MRQRYRYDGEAVLDLDDVQQRVRDQVAAKVASGEYETEPASCPLCTDAPEEVLAEKDRYGLRFRVVICKSCGLIFTNPRMTQGAYARFYDEEYRLLYHGRGGSKEGRLALGRQRGKEIAAFCQTRGLDLRGKRVAEVGCGGGGILHYLRERHGCNVFGCDLDAQAMRYGRAEHGLDLQHGNAGVLPAGRADLVIYSHVLEHLLAPLEECSQVRRLLAPGGLLFIEVPSVKDLRREPYHWDFLRLMQNAHTYHFTLRTLTNVMNRGGFERLAGNETARALFRPGEGSAAAVVSDYDDVMRFLRAAGAMRAAGLGAAQRGLKWLIPRIIAKLRIWAGLRRHSR